MQPGEFLTTAEAAKLLRRTVSAMNQGAAKAGVRLTFNRATAAAAVGAVASLYRRTDIERWLAEHTPRPRTYDHGA